MNLTKINYLWHLLFIFCNKYAMLVFFFLGAFWWLLVYYYFKFHSKYIGKALSFLNIQERTMIQFDKVMRGLPTVSMLKEKYEFWFNLDFISNAINNLLDPQQLSGLPWFGSRSISTVSPSLLLDCLTTSSTACISLCAWRLAYFQNLGGMHDLLSQE